MILPRRGAMAFNNVVLPIDASSVPSNVRYVIWHDLDGEIEYNDRMGLRTRITDPSPYQACINNWFTAALAATPALSLVQAQQVKNDFVDVLFSIKRQASISVTLLAGTLSFDASDPATAILNTPGAAGGSMTLIELNAAMAQAQFDLNGVILGVLANVGSFPNPAPPTMAATTDSFASYVSAINAQIASIYSQMHTWGVTWSGVSDYPAISAAISGSGANVAAINAAFSAFCASLAAEAPAAPILMQALPIGATTPLILQPSDFAIVVNAIAARGAALQLQRLNRQNALAAFATVADVIAYDVTAGW